MKNAERLIEAVRSRPFLYDQSLQTFRHIGAKNDNWMEVARMIHGRDDKNAVYKVKMQWKSLRDAFVKQQRKRQQNTKSLVRPYVYESELQFLLPHILLKEKDEQSNPESTVSNSKITVKSEDSLSLNASISGESQPEMEQVPEEYVDQKHSAQTFHGDDAQMKKTNVTEMHPVDAFFHGLAQTVKTLKPATVARLKKTVANLVMDAEIEEIESNNGGTTCFTYAEEACNE